ncbi:YggT family protein [Corticicoccus populi]|uniref:YggT family protein n=1 Tax=Corticicoccus populi TaxID=1812821 RepID=A0ABW5WWK1_9STAP
MDKGLLLQIIVTVSDIVSILLTLFSWGLIIYILSSWIPGLRESSFGQTLGKVYEPVLEPIRNLIPPLGGMLDLSPIILFLVLRLFVAGLDSIFNALIRMIV